MYLQLKKFKLTEVDEINQYLKDNEMDLAESPVRHSDDGITIYTVKSNPIEAIIKGLRGAIETQKMAIAQHEVEKRYEADRLTKTPNNKKAVNAEIQWDAMIRDCKARIHFSEQVIKELEEGKLI